MPPIAIALIVIFIILIVGAIGVWVALSSGAPAPPPGGLPGAPPGTAPGGDIPGGSPSGGVPNNTGFGPGDYLRRPDGTIGRIQADGTMRAYASWATYESHGKPAATDVSTEVFNSFPRGPNY